MAKRNTVAAATETPVETTHIVEVALTDETPPDNVKIAAAVKWPNSRARAMATIRAGSAFEAAKALNAEANAVDNTAEVAALQAELDALTERRKVLRDTIEALSPSRSALWQQRALLLLQARLWRAGVDKCRAFCAFVQANVGVTLPTSNENVVEIHSMLGNYCAFQRSSKDSYAVSPGMIKLANEIRADFESVRIPV